METGYLDEQICHDRKDRQKFWQRKSTFYEEVCSRPKLEKDKNEEIRKTMKKCD